MLLAIHSPINHGGDENEDVHIEATFFMDDLMEELKTASDVNQDGKVDDMDLQQVLRTAFNRSEWQLVREGEATPEDIDGSGEVDAFDVLIVLASIMPPLGGTVNFGGDVLEGDLIDLVGG